ncbi:MAG: hypothetical protein H7Z38_02410 [Rubrivivax sp.]|nr:hypothetical protein [Pyrinomonadaceae bacterium]
MAQLKNKVQSALDESRMLVLGSQVLLGFQFRSMMEPGFESLPLPSQLLKLVALGLMLLAIALLISPSSYHRLVERGEDTEEVHRYTSRVMLWAMLPFAFALGIDLYVVTQKIIGWKAGAAAGLLGVLVAVSFWYLLELYRRRVRADEIAEARKEEQKMDDEKDAKRDERTKLSDKIRHVLTETRTVLPGAQALLGFQFVGVLMESFDKLPNLSKYIHLASLGMIALTIVLLMTPAAYHRIVEQGEETEHFHRFASKMVVAALIPLALGLCGDVYVVVQKVSESQLVSVVAALVTLAIFWELWFGVTLYRRTQREYAR